MKAKLISIMLLACGAAAAQSQTDGWYKDVWMDGGILLTSMTDLPSARVLGLSIEKFVSSTNTPTTRLTQVDTLLQTAAICGNPMDENGILLYPDGAPRFRVIYMNGGKAVNHGRTLGEKGRANIVSYIDNGGSYVGSCAGAFLASAYTITADTLRSRAGTYLGIWPGAVRGTMLDKSWTDVTIEKKSPLLRYYDFGGDRQVDSVRHNGGCYAFEQAVWPEEAEVLARYKTTGRELKRDIDGMPVIWSIKKGPSSGRVISCGSHPESVTEGERLDLMCAMLKYAMDGNGEPAPKCTMAPGDTVRMTRRTSQCDPAHTRIGDKQYHHFVVDIPAGRDSVTVTLKSLKGWRNFDLYLFASKDGLAKRDCSDVRNIRLGVDKSIVLHRPKSGKYYVSVFCDTTVDAVEGPYGTSYQGRMDVLNGVPYILIVQ